MMKTVGSPTRALIMFVALAAPLSCGAPDGEQVHEPAVIASVAARTLGVEGYRVWVEGTRIEAELVGAEDARLGFYTFEGGEAGSRRHALARPGRPTLELVLDGRLFCAPLSKDLEVCLLAVVTGGGY